MPVNNVTKVRMGFVPGGLPFVSKSLARRWTTNPRNVRKFSANPGFVVELAVELCLAASATLECEFVLLNHTGYGAKDENGTWNGMVADIMAEIIDCSMPELDRNRDRESVVAYTMDIRRAPLNAVTRFHADAQPHLLAFGFDAAVALLGLVLIVTLIMSTISAIGNFPRWRHTFLTLLGETMLCLIQRSWASTFNEVVDEAETASSDRCNRKNQINWKSLKLTLMVWNAGCFMIGAFYGGMIVKTLLTPLKNFPFRSFQQMADCFGPKGTCVFMIEQITTNFYTIVTNKNGAESGTHFRNVSRRLAESPILLGSYLKKNSPGIPRITNGKEQYFVEFISADGLSTLLEHDHGKCTYYVHDMRYYAPQGIGCRKGDPRIELFNAAIHEAQMHGMLMRIFNRYNHLEKLMDYQYSVCYHPDIVLHSLNLFQLSEAVYPLSALFGLALLTLVLEGLWRTEKAGTETGRSGIWETVMRKFAGSSRVSHIAMDDNFIMKKAEWTNDAAIEIQDDNESVSRMRHDLIRYVQTVSDISDLNRIFVVLRREEESAPCTRNLFE